MLSYIHLSSIKSWARSPEIIILISFLGSSVDKIASVLINHEVGQWGLLLTLPHCVTLLAGTWAGGRTLGTRELAVVLVLSATGREVGAVAPHVQDRLELRVDHAQGGGEQSTLEDVGERRRGVGNNGLVDEAHEALRVLQVVEAVDQTAGNVASVDALEGVDGTGVAADEAGGRPGHTLLGSGDTNVNEGPRVLLRALVPVLGDLLGAAVELQVSGSVASVAEEVHVVLLGHVALGELGRVVGHQFPREHVSAEGEGDAGVGWGEVVGVGGNAVLLAVVGVLGKDTRGDEAVCALIGEVEELLHELGVRPAVRVVVWCEPVSSGDGGISLGAKVTVRADTGLVAQKLAEHSKGVGLV
jgi:hypothetical protein